MSDLWLEVIANKNLINCAFHSPSPSSSSSSSSSSSARVKTVKKTTANASSTRNFIFCYRGLFLASAGSDVWGAKKKRRKDEKISLQLKTKLTFFYAHFLLLARKIVLCDSKRNAVVLCGGRLQVTMASTNAIEFIVTRSLVVSPK